MKRPMMLTSSIMIGIICCITALQPAHAQNNRTEWFKEAKFGVFIHFLGGGPEWSEKVNAFDVDQLAKQIVQTKAGYLIFTLGQNSGYYCSPNATYEKYAGYKIGERCPARDLPMELADKLLQSRIKMMLYLPSRSPQTDKQAMSGLHDVHQSKPAPQEFTKRWSDVIREWSLRYKEKAAGWWFDGAYNSEGWDDISKPNSWKTWAAACRAGNPDSILAFNRGANLEIAFIKQTDEQDYTAGERTLFDATPKTYPSPKPLQWHLLSFLGSNWGKKDGPTNSNQYMIDYIKKVNTMGGVVSIDVGINSDGSIYQPHLDQLMAIGKALNAK